MNRTSLRWALVALVGIAMGCASKQHTAPAKAEKKAEAAATGTAAAGKVVTNPAAEAFPVVIGKAIKVDGDLSDWPAGLPVGRVGNADGTHAVNFRVFVDAERVYAAFLVTDTTPSINKQQQGQTYDGDALELFLGTHDDARGALKPGDVQVLISYNPPAPHAWQNFSNVPMRNAQVVEKDVPGGWIVEASFTLAELGLSAPAPGAPVWIDVALDNGNGGARSAQYPWLGTLDLWKTPSMWKKSSFVAQP